MGAQINYQRRKERHCHTCKIFLRANGFLRSANEHMNRRPHQAVPITLAPKGKASLYHCVPTEIRSAGGSRKCRSVEQLCFKCHINICGSLPAVRLVELISENIVPSSHVKTQRDSIPKFHQAHQDIGAGTTTTLVRYMTCSTLFGRSNLLEILRKQGKQRRKAMIMFVMSSIERL